MAESTAWKEECKRRDWSPIFLSGDSFAKFIETETARVEEILKDLGLAT
jgi:putative tricarboxylic transport membrane protein